MSKSNRRRPKKAKKLKKSGKTGLSEDKGKNILGKQNNTTLKICQYIDIKLKFTEPQKIVGICPNFGPCCHGNANNRKSFRKNISCSKPLRKILFVEITSG